jgi:hypothetical protein
MKYHCPVLISAVESGWLKADRVKELSEGLNADGPDMTPKFFTSEETAAAHGHAENTALAIELIFDWIVSPRN